jgi:hypothetical protein
MRPPKVHGLRCQVHARTPQCTITECCSVLDTWRCHSVPSAEKPVHTRSLVSTRGRRAFPRAQLRPLLNEPARSASAGHPIGDRCLHFHCCRVDHTSLVVSGCTCVHSPGMRPGHAFRQIQHASRLHVYDSHTPGDTLSTFTLQQQQQQQHKRRCRPGSVLNPHDSTVRLLQLAIVAGACSPDEP